MGFLLVRRSVEPAPEINSLDFVTNAADDHEHAAISVLPDGFGDAEFTLELWVRPRVASFSAASDGSAAQLTDWMTFNPAPYDTPEWWFRGNFLLDGHNNTDFFAGTLSLQFANGRVRATFGDGAAADARSGDLHGVVGTTNIVDGAWHKIAFVRRWDGGTGAILELWVDGVMEDSETTTARTNMATTYWDSWSGFPVNQRNWMFGTEKQAATTVNLRTQYEDYKGEMAGPAFFGIARATGDLENYTAPWRTTDAGMLDFFDYAEQTGSTSVPNLDVAGDMTLVNQQAGGMWSTAAPY